MYTTVTYDPDYVARMHMIGQTIQNDQIFRAKVEVWMGELIYIAWCDKVMDENRYAFLAAEHKDRVQEIGNAINDMGNIGLMQYVSEVIRGMVPHPVDIRTLEFAWDGIGEWKC